MTVGFRSAVVTGAGSGLGQALTWELAERGCSVVAADVDGDRLAVTQDRARTGGLAGDVHPWVCDVRDRESVAALATGTDELIGAVDLLVNNAGIGFGGRPVGGWTDQDWLAALDVNVRGVVNGCEVFLPRMRAAGAGKILNVASAAGLLSPAGMGPYNVSKAAVVSLTETMAAELVGSGVQVSVLCPGFFPSRVVEDGVREGRIDPDQARRATAVMAKSPRQASDMAVVALDGVARGRTYIVPENQIRFLWLMKRLLPTPYLRALAPMSVRRVVRRTRAASASEPAG